MSDHADPSNLAALTGERIADQLLADLYAGVIPKIGLDEIEQYVAGHFISIPAPRPSFREIVNWTVKFVIERHERAFRSNQSAPAPLPLRNMIYGTNEQAE
jgi:hypothetical protein